MKAVENRTFYPSQFTKIKGTKTGNKFNANTTRYNGTNYHSKLEAQYAMMLDWRIKAKEVKSWEGQYKLDLRANGEHITNYYIDFVATMKDGTREFIECKGFFVDLWALKWQILRATADDHMDRDDVLVLVRR